jgi:hypothetical protein
MANLITLGRFILLIVLIVLAYAQNPKLQLAILWETVCCVFAGGRILNLRQLAAFLIFTLRWFTHLRKDVWKKNKAYLAGLKPNKIQHLAEQLVAQALLPNLSPVAKRRLETHLAQGDIVVLLTGTPDFIAWPLPSGWASPIPLRPFAIPRTAVLHPPLQTSIHLVPPNYKLPSKCVEISIQRWLSALLMPTQPGFPTRLIFEATTG